MAVYQQSYPTLSEAAYNNLFRYNNAPGQPTNPMVGAYQQVTDAANRAGIPPSLFASIIAQETGFGRYNSNSTGGGRIYTHNNPAGVMDPASNWRRPMQYGSFQEGLDAAATTAARIYQRGGTVLPTIQNIYAPTDPQPANDPRGLNQDWLPNVTRFLRNIAGTMSPADYEALQPGLLAADQEQLLGRIEQLQPGPSGLLGKPAPWQIAGEISPEVGQYLQTLGLMPSNLSPTAGTDFTNTTWNAIPGSQPGWWGPWGAENVHNWAQEGISHGYGDPIMSMLGNLNYNLVDPGIAPGAGNQPLGGSALAATGGVDLAHWLAQQWGSSWGTRGLDPGLNIWDASPGVHVLNRPFSDSPNVWDASGVNTSWGQHPDLTFWNPSQPGVHVIDQPSGPAGDANPIKVWGGDVTNWVPAAAGSTWGTPGQVSPYTGWQVGQQGMFFNPNTGNWGTPKPGVPGQIGAWDPSGGYVGPGGFTAPGPGGPEDTPIDYQHYFDTMNIGAAPRDLFQTPGPFGTSAVQDYGQPSVTEQIDTTSAQNAAFNAAQVAAFNAQQATHNQQAINNSGNPWGGGWDMNFVNLSFGVPGGPMFPT